MANRDLEALRAIPSLDELVRRLGERRFTPGWTPKSRPGLWKEMRSEFVPARWRFAEAKAAMQAAGRLIGTDLAERRNFIMVNPIPGNEQSTLRTLVAAYQSILPGEKARSHRHAPHALRVILEAKGSYSIVNGHRHPMETGDIVLTPGWHWHGHGHDGAEQAYWFDGLDVPLTHLLEPMFFEEHPEGFEPVTETSPVSPMRFPWADTVAALGRAPEDPAGHLGRTIALPAPAMPTLALKVHAWPAGFRGRPFRQTANTVLVAMQGAGRTLVDGEAFDWTFGDTLAIPGWCRAEHQSEEDSIVFSMSDEQLQRWANYYRFQALDS